MALKQREIVVNPFTMPVGSTEIAANSVCKLDSSKLVVATASSEAGAIYITTEVGAADGFVTCYGIGSMALVNAHDSDLAEGEYWVPAAAGRVDSAAALTGGTQYYIGVGQQASSAQDQKVTVYYNFGIAPDAAS